MEIYNPASMCVGRSLLWELGGGLFLSLLLLHTPASKAFLTADHGDVVSHNGQSSSLRAMSESEFGCNQVLDVIPSDMAGEFLNFAINDIFEDDPLTKFFFQNIINQWSVHGFEVRKLCASCDEFDIQHSEYQRFCGSGVYGYNQSFSGLVMLPLDGGNSSSNFLSGTLRGSIYAHPSVINRVPTAIYNGTHPDFLTLAYGFIPASMGIPALMPDYFGYGVSNAQIYKGYIIPQSYETSMIPLWYKTAQILRQESNCKTELGSAVTILGYSEGGFASIVLGQALHNLGWDVTRIHAGGVPAKAGSILIPQLLRNADIGNKPGSFSAVFSLLGSSFSSTFRDVANYNKGQDLLNVSLRDEVVALVHSGPSRAALIDYLGDDWLRIFDADLLVWMRDVYTTQDDDPCTTRFEPGFNDFLCPAFRASDITELLETASFPIHVYHGSEDLTIVKENLPDFSKNENLTLFLIQNASHNEAAVPMFTDAFSYYTSAHFQTFPMQARNLSNGCSAEPTSSPTTTNMGPVSTDAAPTPSGATRLCLTLSLVTVLIFLFTDIIL